MTLSIAVWDISSVLLLFPMMTQISFTEAPHRHERQHLAVSEEPKLTFDWLASNFAFYPFTLGMATLTLESSGPDRCILELRNFQIWGSNMVLMPYVTGYPQLGIMGIYVYPNIHNISTI